VTDRSLVNGAAHHFRRRRRVRSGARAFCSGSMGQVSHRLRHRVAHSPRWEIFESIKHFGWLKFGLLTVNMAVVAFLVISLMREKRRVPQELMGHRAAQPRPNAVTCEPV